MAFVHFYGIDTSLARRWDAEVVQGVLCATLTAPHETVSKEPTPDESPGGPTKRRPRPHPRRR